MSVIISQKYEQLPTFGVTVGYHKVKVTATQDSFSVLPIAGNLSHSAVSIVKVNGSTPTVAGTSVLTFATAVPTAGDKVIVGGITYSFISNAGTPTAGAFEVRLGASVTETGTNLTKAINNSGATAGTNYSASGYANPFVSAADGSAGVVNLTSLVPGFLGFLGANVVNKNTTPANGVVTTLPTVGVGPMALITSASAGTITLQNCVANSEIELITYHTLRNYNSVG